MQKDSRSYKHNASIDGQRHMICYGCGGIGHVRSKCPRQKRDRNSGRRKGKTTSNVAICSDKNFIPIVDQPSCSTGLIDRNCSMIKLHDAAANGIGCKLLRDMLMSADLLYRR
ncbi:hypothetical protein ElyMa_004160800 [Elysia marginata]|uniref:CCHC-type domain-containing protein n=1 Tax=Elysia marginata TaxID=1093978 RepID=A0AAV4GIL2_9GAST|nr:hypothetical protein ElyMa_004160800 [Elysia marginata]